MRHRTIITMYMVALGKTKLPERVWKKIAQVNSLLLKLDKKNEK